MTSEIVLDLHKIHTHTHIQLELHTISKYKLLEKSGVQTYTIFYYSFLYMDFITKN